MQDAGFQWSLKPEGGKWRWSAVGREDRKVLVEGLANSRSEAAAYLARAISLGVIGSTHSHAA